MRTIHRFILSVAAIVVAGCGGAEDAPERAEPPPVEETVFGDMTDTLEEARGVEETTLQHKKDLDRALEESEGS